MKHTVNPTVKPTAFRFGLAGCLGLLAAVAFIFYQRQNAGLQVGGAISLPKMLWLTYAIAAWFVLPAFLWRDARLSDPVRRLFGGFWVFMMARGLVELFLVYQVGHWSPWYGIAHDLAAASLVIVMRSRIRRPESTTRDRRALGFSTTLVVGLLIETAFAAIFLQTGSAEEKIYFASADGSWRLVNLLTTVVVAFVYLDLGVWLVRSYFPGDEGAPSSWAVRVRAAAAFVLLALVSAVFALWTWMAGAEAEAVRYERVGLAIHDALKTLHDGFLADDRRAMARVVAGGDGAWVAEPVDHAHDFALHRWTSGGPARSFLDALVELRHAHASTPAAAFKIHLIDEVAATGAVVRVRFEIRSEGRVDRGQWRCRMRPAPAGWKVVDANLLHGTTVLRTAPGLFTDRADARGLDFVMQPDLRFTPGAVCEGHACDGPARLRFQTMRHAYGGASAGDIDGDGHDDLFLCAGGKAAVYRNRGDGSFYEVSAEVGLDDLWHVNTAGFADLDNDGDQDLFVGLFFGQNRLFENVGGRFRDVTNRSGLLRDDAVTCFAYLDHDNDGDLDLYLGRFLDASREIPGSFLYARNGEPNRLFRNDGHLHFTDITSAAGLGDVGLALSVAAADSDGDGDQDLYVANDFGRNVFYRNRGDGSFDEVSLETGTFAIGGSMSASWGDIDGDGRLDLYVAAIRSTQRWFVQPVTARRVALKFLREGRFSSDNPLLSDLRKFLGDRWDEIGNHALAGNSLLLQQPDGTFVDRAEAGGARPAGWYWSSGLLDFDQDGDLDILASNGWISGEDPHDL